MKKIIFLLFILIGGSLAIDAQDMDSSKITLLVKSQNYTFIARTMSPQRGSLRQLNDQYDLQVTHDSVISYLPYFGRAYSAPIDPSEAGIKFATSSFDYELQQGKKHRWEIIIKPKDANDVEELDLTVFDNGSATLNVSSVNRQPVSFNGYIIERKSSGKRAF